jgi:sugar/nucleoside kinase (ribokinase family)
MFDIFCFGGISLDLYLKVPRLPAPDEKLLTEFLGPQAGGLIANTACAASRLGLKVGWSGQIGDDDFGRILLKDFTEFSVNASFSSTSPSSMSDFCVILLDATGERTILVVPTHMNPLPLSKDVLGVLAQSRIGYTIPQELDWFEQFSNAVKSANGLVAIDLEGSSPVQGAVLTEVLKMTDIVFCSPDGLKLAAGKDTLQENAEQILAWGVDRVVVTQGRQGATSYHPVEITHVPGFPAPVLDSTGAGDCFHAAYMTGLLENWDTKRCLSFANAAAAISVQSMGARGGLPNRSQIEAFLKTHTKAQ